MAFFKQSNTPDQELCDREFARTLAEAILRARRQTITPSIGKWTQDFRRLRTTSRVSKNRIRKVLQWFCEHIKDQYVPVIHSAEGFRRKFYAIQESMRRNPVQKIIITEEARTLQEETGLHWPKGEKSQELQFIQRSLNNYNQWVHQLYKCSQDDPDPEWRDTFNYLWNAVQDDATEYIGREWLTYIHHLAWEWPKWQGSLLRWVWHPEQRSYAQWAQQELFLWDGDADHFPKLVQRLHRHFENS